MNTLYEYIIRIHYMNTFLSHLAHFFWGREIIFFSENVVEKIKTHFIIDNFASKSISFVRLCGKIL
jgi:hypothetical protein